MAKTYRNLISESRELLQDSLTPYRFTDSYMLNTFNRGMQYLGTVRPDAFTSFYRANSLNIPTIVSTTPVDETETNWNDVFGINMMFYTPLMLYTIGSIELTEDEFTVDGRAMTLLQQLRNSVLSI